MHLEAAVDPDPGDPSIKVHPRLNLNVDDSHLIKPSNSASDVPVTRERAREGDIRQLEVEQDDTTSGSITVTTLIQASGKAKIALVMGGAIKEDAMEDFVHFELPVL